MTGGPEELRRVGRYRLLEEIAKGGMGQVFVAQKDGSLDVCVIKLLHSEAAAADDGSAQRLVREAHLLSLMSHPHISQVLDAGFEDDGFFLALEFIPGRTLQEIQRVLRKERRRVPPEVTMMVAADVLSGLMYAHNHRDPEGKPIHLVHRDLSPNNVMLSYTGDAKIIDFGIASGKIDTFKTKPGHIMGTPRYLSPEQATMKPIDHKSDLYSLSVVLYGMLLGRPMIKKGPPGQVLGDILNKTPRPLPEMVPDFPEALWEVLDRGLQKDRDVRWQTAEEFRDALLRASPWELPTREQVGSFLDEWFPEGRAWANALIEKAKATAVQISEPGGFFDTTGIDIPLKKKPPPTEPEVIPREPHPSEDAKTAEIIQHEIAVQQATDLDTGPTVANDPSQFPPGILDVEIGGQTEEDRRALAHEKTAPNLKMETAPKGPPLVLWMVVALGVGIGLALLANVFA